MTDITAGRGSIAVVGVGTMGAMAMWRLALAGYDVTGYERFGVPHDRGAHGAETRIYRMAYREGAMYIPLLQHSHERWMELTALSGRPVFTQNGCLYISDMQRPWLEETISSAEAAGIPLLELNDAELAARYPQHRIYGGERAILDLLGGTLRPELAVLSAAEAAKGLGAKVHQYAPVSQVEPDDHGVTIVLDDGERRRHDYAVVTSGAWTGGMQRDHGFGITARRLPGTWYAAEDPSRFVPARFPVCLRAAGDLDYSGFPSVDGWSVKVMPPVFPDTETIAEMTDRDISAQDTAYTRNIVDKLLIGLHPDPVRTGVYLDGFTPDDIPVIDYSSASDRVVGAVGFGGHGFKMAPAVGQLLADLIAERNGDEPSALAGFRTPFSRHRL